MRALVVPSPGSLELKNIAEPAPGPYEALVRIQGCGICATTDHELIRGRQPYHRDYPMVLGHEAVGEVVALGAKVTSFKIGDRVTRPVAIWPGETREGLASGWGGFAEYGVVRDRLAMLHDGDARLRDDYTAQRQLVIPSQLETGDAILAISLSETLSWFQHVPSVARKTVCISGTGIAGLSMVLWSVLAGAGKIIVLGRRNERLAMARSLGADAGLNVTEGEVAKRLREANGGRGADFFFEAVGVADQINVGLSVLAPGGIIALYGAPEGQRYDLDFSAGPGGVQICQYPAEEHLAYAHVARLIQRGIVPTKSLMGEPWRMNNFEVAFKAVADGQVLKTWIDLK